MNRLPNVKLRYNLITVFVYVIGIVLLLQLFNLQIIHGEEYRQTSNTRLTRESVLEAARGSMYDRTGTLIAGTTMGFSINLYKSKIDNKTLNDTILNMVEVLEQNGDSYVDSFPITNNPYKFTFSDEAKQIEWKKKNNIQEQASPEECILYFKNKYDIQNEDLAQVRKIISIRYQITQEGYSSTKPIKISQNVSRQSILIFREQSNKFPGINIVEEPIRIYPNENLASHIVGYIGKVDPDDLKNNDTYRMTDIIGKEGIEKVFEKYLKGKNGIKQIDMAVDGTVTDEYIYQEAVAGADIVLTIDANLQKIAEDAIKTNIEKIANGEFGEKFDTKAGSVIVMDVSTGEILALACYPDFNPQLFVDGISSEMWNQYRDNEALYNRAITGSYAPGSIFKMVTAIAGLESGVITTTQKINDTGIYPLYHQPKCWYWTSYHSGHGYLNVSQAIQHSCNYFFYEIGNKAGIDNISKYATYFGLGQKTKIELLAESTGSIAKRKEGETWYPGNTLSAAIGQMDNNLTPIQVAKYISMLSNGGKNITPTIIKSIITKEGNEISRQEIRNHVNSVLGLDDTTQENLNIKQENLDAILEGMRSVTGDSGGTAYSTFRNFGIEVGGKTGSAEAGDKTHAWFVGFAPFDSPEIAVIVQVENGGHGNYTAGVARDIMAQYFGMNASKIQEDMSAKPYVESFR